MLKILTIIYTDFRLVAIIIAFVDDMFFYCKPANKLHYRYFCSLSWYHSTATQYNINSNSKLNEQQIL